MENRNPDPGKSRLLGEYLRRQQDELGVYLGIMECQAEAIAGDNADLLASYSDLEKASIARLENLRLVSLALSRGLSGATRFSGPEGLAALRAALRKLGREALARNGANRRALAAKMEELRRRLEDRPRGRRPGSAHRPSVYAGIPGPSLVDLQG